MTQYFLNILKEKNSQKLESVIRQIVLIEFPGIKGLRVGADIQSDQVIVEFDEGKYTREEVEAKIIEKKKEYSESID